MNYSEFRDRLGKLTVPEGQIYDELIEGNDSIHLIFVVGKLIDDKYEMNDYFSDDNPLLDALNILEIREAVRDRDYIVTGNLVGNIIQVGVHSTHKFLSDEDFDLRIKRMNTK